MSRLLNRCLGLVLAGVMAAGCSGGKNPEPEGATLDKDRHLLAAEPAGAKGVADVRKGAGDNDAVVVVGRIGGSGKPFTGRASFTVVDLSLEPCEDDGCGNPWCSADEKELKQGMALVKFVDDRGRTLAADAEKALGLKICQTIVVQGKARRDTEGNLTILADGLFLRPEAKK
jgi:hypothetical protein